MTPNPPRCFEVHCSRRTLKPISRRFAAPLLLLLGSFLGCSEAGPPIAAVTGIVTFQGAPVPDGVVIFISDSGFGSSAALQPDGTYLVQSHHGKGIPLGEYSVIVTPPEEPDLPEGSPPVKRNEYKNIPKKFRQFETSPLRMTVRQEKENVFNIEMKP